MKNNKDMQAFIKQYGEVGQILLNHPCCKNLPHAEAIMDSDYRGAFISLEAFAKDFLSTSLEESGYGDVIAYIDYARYGYDLLDDKAIFYVHTEDRMLHIFWTD